LIIIKGGRADMEKEEEEENSGAISQQVGLIDMARREKK